MDPYFAKKMLTNMVTTLKELVLKFKLLTIYHNKYSLFSHYSTIIPEKQIEIILMFETFVLQSWNI